LQQQIPNYKSQITNNSQISILNDQHFKIIRILVIGIYLGLGAWKLVLPHLLSLQPPDQSGHLGGEVGNHDNQKN
jgi:hypothetical protein